MDIIILPKPTPPRAMGSSKCPTNTRFSITTKDSIERPTIEGIDLFDYDN